VHVRTGFLALPLGELAFAKQMTERVKAFLFEEGVAAQAVTEGAAREQVCIRVSLIRQGQLVTPSVLPRGGKPAPS